MEPCRLLFFIELCFVAFLSNKSKKCFILVWIIFRLQKLSRYRFCIALYGRSGNKRSNLSELNFDIKFCEIEAEDFKRHSTSYWLNVGVGYLESLKFLHRGKRLGLKKPFWPIRLEHRQPCCRGVTHCASKDLWEYLSNISQIDFLHHIFIP